ARRPHTRQRTGSRPCQPCRTVWSGWPPTSSTRSATAAQPSTAAPAPCLPIRGIPRHGFRSRWHREFGRDQEEPLTCLLKLRFSGDLERERAAHRVLHRERHPHGDRKSTRLNSSHVKISYAVFCLKKKNNVDSHARSESRAFGAG